MASGSEDEVDDDRNSRKRKVLDNGKYGGRWLPDEHQKFVEGMRLYGKEWILVEGHVKTRTSVQIQSHAQKFYLKLQKNSNIEGGDLLPILQKNFYALKTDNYEYYGKYKIARILKSCVIGHGLSYKKFKEKYTLLPHQVYFKVDKISFEHRTDDQKK